MNQPFFDSYFVPYSQVRHAVLDLLGPKSLAKGLFKFLLVLQKLFTKQLLASTVLPGNSSREPFRPGPYFLSLPQRR